MTIVRFIETYFTILTLTIKQIAYYQYFAHTSNTVSDAALNCCREKQFTFIQQNTSRGYIE